MQPDIISRQEAIVNGLRHYMTGNPCKRGHVEKRFVSSGECLECNRIRSQKTFKLDPKKYTETIRRSRAKHADKVRAASQLAYRTDRERILVKNRKRFAENKDRYRENYIKKFLANPERYLAPRQKWRENNIEKLRKKSLEWQRNNPEKASAIRARRRARLAAAEGKFIAEDISSLLKRQAGKCAYCFVRFGKKYHVDHIVPLARGGSNWPDNLQLCCGPCNLSKGAKDPAQFARSIGRLI